MGKNKLDNYTPTLPQEILLSHEYAQLTDQQKIFIDVFMKTNGDEKQAGEVAGYHRTNARKVLLSPRVQKVLSKYWDEYAMVNNRINTTEETLIMLSEIAYASENTNTMINGKTGEVFKAPPTAMERIKAMELLLKVSGAINGSNTVNISIDNGGKLSNVEYITEEELNNIDMSEVIDLDNYDIIE